MVPLVVMKFLDQAKLYIKAGDGGPGCVSFRREKFIEFGGPAGGKAVRHPASSAFCTDFGARAMTVR